MMTQRNFVDRILSRPLRAAIPIAAWVGAALVPAAAARAAAPVSPPPVERVVVFSDRAMVVRTQKASCQKGSARVEFKGLVPQLDARTLRAEADSGATALGVAHRIESLDEDADSRVASLKASRQRLDDQLRALDLEQQRIQERAKMNLAYGDYFKGVWREGLRAKRADTRSWSGALDGLESEANRATTRLLELGVKGRGLQRERALVQRKLSRFSARQIPEGLTATVTLKCGKSKTPTVRLSYVVGGAHWSPEYDLRFTGTAQGGLGKGRAELTVGASVTQSTGEDWEGATVVLSTAKPRLGARAPMPRALWVDGHEVGKDRVLVQATEKREALSQGSKANAAGPVGAALEDHGQSIELTIPHKVTIRADGRPTWFPVDKASTPARAQLVAYPKLSSYVYQVVRLKTPTSYPLLAGKVHTYRGGSYVGDTAIKYHGAGEPIELSLGLDERIRLERVDLNRIDHRPGFLSKTRHLKRAYQVTLESHARAPLTVEIHERIPVSKEEDVTVELDRKKTSPGFVLDAYRGFVTWKAKVIPGKTQRTELHYVIHLPESWQLGGR